MAIPYHTHNFEIPTATQEDVLAGVSNDKVVVPSILGTAALKAADDFATAEQGVKADNAVKKDTKVTVGEGLEGGGNLSGNIDIKLSESTKNSLTKADNAALNTTRINVSSDLSGGGDLSRDLEISLSHETVANLNKAKTAVQPSSLGDLAYKDKIEIADIKTTSTPSPLTFLSGDGTWKAPNGSGDMLSTIYDPNKKNADAFDLGNMVENPTFNKNTGALILTNSERQKIKDHTDFINSIKDYVLDVMVSGEIEMHPFQDPGYRMMVANGAIYKRNDFPILWAAIKDRKGLVTENEWHNGLQGAYSIGNGSTTFRVPNLLNYFPRFADLSRHVGSTQGDAIRNITGSIASNSWSWLMGGTGAIRTTSANADGVGYSTNGYRSGLTFDASRVVPTANENRPRNIAFMPFIRF